MPKVPQKVKILANNKNFIFSEFKNTSFLFGQCWPSTSTSWKVQAAIFYGRCRRLHFSRSTAGSPFHHALQGGVLVAILLHPPLLREPVLIHVWLAPSLLNFTNRLNSFGENPLSVFPSWSVQSLMGISVVIMEYNWPFSIKTQRLSQPKISAALVRWGLLPLGIWSKVPEVLTICFLKVGPIRSFILINEQSRTYIYKFLNCCLHRVGNPGPLAP